MPPRSRREWVGCGRGAGEALAVGRKLHACFVLSGRHGGSGTPHQPAVDPLLLEPPARAVLLRSLSPIAFAVTWTPPNADSGRPLPLDSRYSGLRCRHRPRPTALYPSRALRSLCSLPSGRVGLARHPWLDGLFQRLPLLWRFHHRMHHTDPDDDFALGFHPLETLVDVKVLIGAPETASYCTNPHSLSPPCSLKPTRPWSLRAPAALVDRHLGRTASIAQRLPGKRTATLVASCRRGTRSSVAAAISRRPDTRVCGFGLDELRGGKGLRLSWMLVHPLVTTRLEQWLFGSSPRVSESGTLNREGA